MKELRKYYTSRMITLAVILVVASVSISYFIPNLTSTYGETCWFVIVLKYLISRPAIVGYMTGGHFLINNWLWAIEKPELDFRGIWNGKTTYERNHQGKTNVDLPFSKDHIVKIKQTCLNIELSPTESDVFKNWGSLAVNLSDEYTIQYAYWVNYADTTLFPSKAKGYEELKVVNSTNPTSKKPMKLTGVFYHCAEGQKPVYSGSVDFDRSTFKN